MAINSKQKGARAERLASQYLSELFGIDFRRSQQYCGANSDADVVSDDHIADNLHFEVKAVERLNIEEAMIQAVADSEAYQVPVVLHKRNRTGWRLTIRGEDLLAFLDACNAIVDYGHNKKFQANCGNPIKKITPAFANSWKKDELEDVKEQLGSSFDEF